ncbi:MAG: hypothetical protein IKH13_06345 [Clostridia bacterium]|nr:hypothetical protein [Clostridia bacterium]
MNKLNVFSNKDGFGRLSKNIVCFFDNLKYAKQRAVRGFADCDTWDFNSYLKKLFADGLDYFAANLHSYPERYGSAENWEKELSRVASLVRKLDADDDERPDDYDEIKNEILDWMKDNFDDLWD